MIISIITAYDDNKGIGKDNKLPWNHPEDLKNFKKITEGKTVIMGRKNHDSIGKTLPNRANIVISNTAMQKDFPEGVGVVRNLEYSLSLCRDQEEVFIIGGQSVYEQSLSLCDKMYITHISGSYKCDAFFPNFNSESFRLTYSEELSDKSLFTVMERQK